MKHTDALERDQPAELTCPVSKQGRESFKTWVKRLGWVGFFFFLIKGLLWLIIPYLIAKGLF
jgi:hypothetical protein